MIDLIELSIIPTFLLNIASILAFFMLLPILSYRTITTMFKIVISFFLSLVTMSVLGSTAVQVDHLFFMLLLKEVMVGLLIGLIAYIIVSAVQIAGGFIDFQMGFAVANVIDLQTGAQSPLIGQYFYMFALLFLLSVNGHHLLIDGIINSYQMIPVDSLISIQDVFGSFIITTFN